ncbi:MAG: carboxylating nicotinate-nucleotide diphosphorylase [Bacteroidales bacterium]|jgi:nicotinate-nucleotide pyrophosphorylase (carboxylating)|nr:carboxylating nicotinate-nucleotide diphosphorylase [Bacteroidales bacterium]
MTDENKYIQYHIQRAIAEDLGDGDHTSLSTIPADARGTMQLLVRENGIIAGIDIAAQVFQLVDAETQFTPLLKDGQTVKAGDIAFRVKGRVISLLSAERLALNYMQRMSGIATKTAYYVSLLEGLPTRLLDTRKTTPGMRIFEKIAVNIGGGYNHRFGLFDMILIKNNHVDFAGGVCQAIEAANAYLQKTEKNLPIEIEVRNFEELQQALDCGKIQRIMLDNFTPEMLKKAIEKIENRFETEASGGITEKTIYGYAQTGVDFISVGALTHHIKSLDLSLRAVIL